MGGTKIDVDGSDARFFDRFDPMVEYQRTTSSNAPVISNGQPAQDQPDPEKADAAPKDGEVGAAQDAKAGEAKKKEEPVVNITGNATLRRARDISIKEFEHVIEDKFTSKAESHFLDGSIDGAVDNVNKKSILQKRKGYFRFKYNENKDGLALQRAATNIFRWIPLGFRTNLKSRNHNEAMRNTLVAAVQDQFKGISIPQDLLHKILGEVEVRDSKSNLGEDKKGNDYGALSADEVAHVLYRNATVLNTEEARKKILVDTMTMILRKASPGLDRIPQEMNGAMMKYLGFDLQSARKNLQADPKEPKDEQENDWLWEMVSQEGDLQVDLKGVVGRTIAQNKVNNVADADKGVKINTTGEEDASKVTMQALRDDAAQFLEQVRNFANKMSQKLRIATVNAELRGICDLLKNNEQIIGDLSVSIPARLQESIHKNLCESLKAVVNIPGLTEEKLEKVVGIYCAGSPSAAGDKVKSPLDNVLDYFFRKLGGAAGSREDDLKSADFSAYILQNAEKFVRGYLAVEEQAKTFAQPDQPVQQPANAPADPNAPANANAPQAPVPQSPDPKVAIRGVCNTVSAEFSAQINQQNTAFKEFCANSLSHGVELAKKSEIDKIPPPLDNEKILVNVFTDRFCTFFSEQYRQENIFGDGSETGIRQEDVTGILNQSGAGKTGINLASFTELSAVEKSDTTMVSEFFTQTKDGEELEETLKADYANMVDHHFAQELHELNQTYDFSVKVGENNDGTERREIVDFSSKTFTTSVDDMLKENLRGVKKQQDNPQGDSLNETIATMKTIWGGISLVKNGVKTITSIASLSPAAGLISMASGLGAVGGSAYTNFLDVKKFLTAKNDLDKAKVDLKGQMDELRKEVKNSAWNLSDGDSVAASLASALKKSVTDRMSEKLMDVSKSWSKQNNAEANPFAKCKDDTLQSVEWLGRTIKELIGNVANTAGHIQKKSFSLFNLIPMPLFDDANGGASFENEFRKKLKNVDLKSLCDFVGIAASTADIDDTLRKAEDQKAVRTRLEDLCVLRFIEAMGLAMKDAVNEFAGELGTSYVKLIENVDEYGIVNPPDKSEYLKLKDTGVGFELSEAGEARLRQITAKTFTQAYQLQLDLLVRTLTDVVVDPNTNRVKDGSKVSPKYQQSIKYDTLSGTTINASLDKLLKAYKEESNIPNATLNDMLQAKYPKMMMFYKSEERMKIFLRSGFIKGVYNDAYLNNYSPKGADGLVLQSSTSVTFAQKVKQDFEKMADEKLKTYLASTEETLAELVRGYGAEFADAVSTYFASPEDNQIDLKDDEKRMFEELGKIVGEKDGKSFLAELVIETLANSQEGDKAVIEVNNLYDKRVSLKGDVLKQKLGSGNERTKFMKELLRQFKTVRESWNNKILDLAKTVDHPLRSYAVTDEVIQQILKIEDNTKESLADLGKAYGITNANDAVLLLQDRMRNDPEMREFIRQRCAAKMAQLRENPDKYMSAYLGSDRVMVSRIAASLADELRPYLAQLVKNWSQFTRYEPYKELKALRGGDLASSLKAVGRVMDQMFTEVRANTSSAQLLPSEGLSSEQLSNHYSLYNKEFFANQKTIFSEDFTLVRDKLAQNATVVDYVQKKMASLAAGLQARLGDQQNVSEETKEALTAFTKRAQEILATKIVARSASIEVATTLGEENQKAKLEELLNAYGETAFAEVEKSFDDLSVASLFLDLGFDQNWLNLSFEAFMKQCPNEKVFDERQGEDGEVTQTFKSWLQSAVAAVVDTLKPMMDANARKELCENLVFRICGSIVTTKPIDEACDEAIRGHMSEWVRSIDAEKAKALEGALKAYREMSLSENAVGGFWTAKGSGNSQFPVAKLQSILLSHAQARLEEQLVDNVDYDKDKNPRPQEAQEVADYRSTFREQLQSVVFGKPEERKDRSAGFAAGLLTQISDLTTKRIKDQFLKAVASNDAGAIFLKVHLKEMMDQANKKPENKDKPLSEEEVLEKYISDVSKSVQKEFKVQDQLVEMLSQPKSSTTFDRIANDFLNRVYSMTYYRIVGGVKVMAAANSVYNLDTLFGDSEKLQARLTKDFNESTITKEYVKYHPDSDIAAYVTSLRAVLTQKLSSMPYTKFNSAGYIVGPDSATQSEIDNYVDTSAKGYSYVVATRNKVLGILEDLLKKKGGVIEQAQQRIKNSMVAQLINFELQVQNDNAYAPIFACLSKILCTPPRKVVSMAQMFKVAAPAKSVPNDTKPQGADKDNIANLFTEFSDLIKKRPSESSAVSTSKKKETKKPEDSLHTWQMKRDSFVTDRLLPALGKINTMGPTEEEYQVLQQWLDTWMKDFQSIDLKQIVDNSKIQKIDASIKTLTSDAMADFVKKSHSPEKFFSSSSKWWRNGVLFGFIPVNAPSLDEKTILAAAQKFIQDHAENQNKVFKDQDPQYNFAKLLVSLYKNDEGELLQQIHVVLGVDLGSRLLEAVNRIEQDSQAVATDKDKLVDAQKIGLKN